MCKKIKVIFLIIVVGAIAIRDGLTQTNNTNDSSLPLYGQIEHQIVMFETYRSVASVKQLDDSIDTLETISFINRKEHAGIWIEILSMIDNNLNTNFDIMVPQFSWVVKPPPDGTNGYQYPPGILPEVLKDPVARSNYEAAILENSKKAEKSHLQAALFRLNKRASSSFERFLKSSYTSSETDKKEISEMLGKAALSPARKQKINSIMGLSSEIPSTK